MFSSPLISMTTVGAVSLPETTVDGQAGRIRTACPNEVEATVVPWWRTTLVAPDQFLRLPDFRDYAVKVDAIEREKLDLYQRRYADYIRTARLKGLSEREILRLAGLAREGRLSLDDLSGGTFTAPLPNFAS